MTKTLYIIDGHAHIYRAFYAPFRELNSPTGEPTRATFVFWQTMLGLIRKRKPDYLAMCMDVSDKTVFRCDIDPDYKAHRDPPPEDLSVQMDRIVSIAGDIGLPIFRLEGFEADDLMATIVEVVKGDDLRVYLVSGDKDLEQLLTDRVSLYDPGKDIEISPDILRETKGYGPEQALEIQTLTGDATDNVPGIHGVGVKTAAKLIARYGTAEEVIANADELTPKMKERVKQYRDRLPVTRRLVTLRRDVPFEFDLEPCRTDRFRFGAVRSTFEQLGFHRMVRVLDDLDGIERATEETPAPKQGDTEFLFEKPSNLESESPGRYELIDSEEKLDRFARRLAAQEVFAFDSETTGLNPVAARLVGLSFSGEAGEGFYIPVRGTMGDTLSEKAIVEHLGPIFQNPDIAKVGHNLKYDLLVLRQLGIRVDGPMFDTMIAHFLLDPMCPSHGLDYLTKNLLDHDMIPISALIGTGRNQISMDEVEIKRTGEYAAEDADFTWRLYKQLEPRITGSPFEKLFRDTEMPLVGVLVEMEQNGVALDGAMLAKMSEHMGDRLIELAAQAQRLAGHEFNVDSTKQLATVLFDEQELPVIRKTKTGRSTDASTLEALVAQTDNPIPAVILEYRGLAKLKNTYCDTLPRMVFDKTGRIHASFNQIGALTGRLSSSDPNLQNIPIRTEAGRRIRRAFIAQDPDSVLLTADYSQVELRILAHLCGDDALVAAFRDGRDIHAAVAAQINGVPIDEVTSAQRSAAKAVNFGIIYGQTAFGLSRGIGVPVGEAQAFINTYFMRYPGIRMFIDRCIAGAKKSGYAETMLGRRRPVPELQSRNRQQKSLGERIAVNTVVQGSAADLIKRAMIDIHNELQRGAHRAKMLIQVHDELVFEIPESHVAAESEMIREKMEHAMTLDVPIKVDLAWARNWAQSKENTH